MKILSSATAFAGQSYGRFVNNILDEDSYYKSQVDSWTKFLENATPKDTTNKDSDFKYIDEIQSQIKGNPTLNSILKGAISKYENRTGGNTLEEFDGTY